MSKINTIVIWAGFYSFRIKYEEIKFIEESMDRCTSCSGDVFILTRIDLHVHTTTSACSIFPPGDLAALATALNLEVVVTTNHHNDTGDVSFLRGAFEGTGITFISGMEITNRWGDFLLFGNGLELFREPREEFPVHLLPRPDVAVIWAHPYRMMPENFVNQLRDRVRPYVDAVETINGNCMLSCPRANRLAQEAADYMNLPATGGSDAHSDNMFMMAWTDFKEPVKNFADLVNQLKQGLTMPGMIKKKN